MCGHLVPILPNECPSDPDLPNCLDASFGTQCEGDGECGTIDIDNCKKAGSTSKFDVYNKSSISTFPTNLPSLSLSKFHYLLYTHMIFEFELDRLNFPLIDVILNFV